MRKELYKDGVYRVANSWEEHAKAISEGWSEDRDPAVTYRPVTAPAPKPMPKLPIALKDKGD